MVAELCDRAADAAGGSLWGFLAGNMRFSAAAVRRKLRKNLKHDVGSRTVVSFECDPVDPWARGGRQLLDFAKPQCHGGALSKTCRRGDSNQVVCLPRLQLLQKALPEQQACRKIGRRYAHT